MSENITLKKEHIYILQIIFALGILYALINENENFLEVIATNIARYSIYMVLNKAVKHLPNLIYTTAAHQTSYLDCLKVLRKKYLDIVILFGCFYILYHLKQKIVTASFLYLILASIITSTPEMIEKQTSISYGVGMACSFFEGYLAHVLPSDGAKFVGFQENIAIFEARQQVVFPVKCLFLIIPKKLYCPPDLKDFNKPNRPDLAYLEACKSLEDVRKDVGGVKNRVYRNSAYKIHRARAAPVYAAAECASPLHTLHRALERRALYAELKDADVDEIVGEFCRMLQSIIDKSPDCCGKCELVYFDNTDPNQNLADVLLKRIEEIRPDFEQFIQNN